MDFEWDEATRRSNLAKHGVDFGEIGVFDWSLAVIREDRRQPSGERRWRALGKIGDRVHTVIYTQRMGFTRVISLRKSKKQEVEAYEQAAISPDA